MSGGWTWSSPEMRRTRMSCSDTTGGTSTFGISIAGILSAPVPSPHGGTRQPEPRVISPVPLPSPPPPVPGAVPSDALLDPGLLGDLDRDRLDRGLAPPAYGAGAGARWPAAARPGRRPSCPAVARGSIAIGPCRRSTVRRSTRHIAAIMKAASATPGRCRTRRRTGRGHDGDGALGDGLEHEDLLPGQTLRPLPGDLGRGPHPGWPAAGRGRGASPATARAQPPWMRRTFQAPCCSRPLAIARVVNVPPISSPKSWPSNWVRTRHRQLGSV